MSKYILQGVARHLRMWPRGSSGHTIVIIARSVIIAQVPISSLLWLSPATLGAGSRAGLTAKLSS